MTDKKVKQLKLKGIRLRKDSEDMKNLAFKNRYIDIIN